MRIVPATIIFLAGMTAGGEVLLLAMGVQFHALTALLAAGFTATFLVLALIVSNIIHPARRPADTAVPGAAQGIHDIIAVCAYCRKVLDDGCTWHPFEEYVLRHFKLRCSHGICPDCISNQLPGRHPDELAVTPQTAATKERSITS